jgi:ketosteroid isomerase-like protein
MLMWKRIGARRYTRTLAALSRGDVEAVLEQFAPDVRFSFVGDSPLGSELSSKQEVREWFGRLFRLLPGPRFEPQEVLIDGWPWDVRIAARVLIHSTVAGAPYTNEFSQFLRLRRGRVVWDYVLEDTQRFERACARLAASGVEEAAAPPLGAGLNDVESRSASDASVAES